jgi:hypothetical protein
MKTETIRELRDERPFRPFELHVADGRVIPVVTVDHLLISPRNDEFVVYTPEGNLQVLDANLVTGAVRKTRKPLKH